jgi:glucan phosphoethanolaminetransferase (alkaline phosphatase superfamily)
LGTRNNFCSNCGEKLDVDVDIEECPKCHTALHEHSKHIQSPPSVVEQLPYKSPGTAALIAFIGGIFALPGIGHIYVGKVGRGIGILILGLILYALSVATIFSLGFLASLEQPNSASEYASAGIGAIAMMLVFSIAYIVLFIWQIFNARKLAKKFNELVKSTGKEPW